MTDGDPRRSVHHHGVAAQVRGDGEPVLLLHGIGSCADGFVTVGRLLARAGFRAVAWDAPGYGGSAAPAADLDADGYVTAALDLLIGIDARPAHVVGVSWGGVIATCLAHRHPEAVRSLTLVDSTRGSAVNSVKAAAMRDRVGELERIGAAEFAHRRAARLVAPDADPAVLAEVERQMGAVRLAGYRSAAEMMATTDTRALLHHIRVPTLVLVGEHDRVTGVAESKFLARRIPGATLTVIRGAGHAASQERPSEVVGAILEFFTRVSRDRPANPGPRDATASVALPVERAWHGPAD